MGSPRDPDPRVTAVIPTIGHALELPDLIRVLTLDGIHVQVWDNGMPQDRFTALIPDGTEVVQAHGVNLYSMWSAAVARATTPYVAVLNDDLVMLPGTIAALADVLDTHPDVAMASPDYRRRIADGVADDAEPRLVTGTYCDGGVCGWAFLVRRSCWPGIDPSFEWWCGDDDLARRVEVAGHKLARLDGWPLDHVGEASASKTAWTHPAKLRDLARFAAIWSTDPTWLAARGH